jgi:hypothetical protein
MNLDGVGAVSQRWILADTRDGAPREHAPSVSFRSNVADGIEIAFKFPPSF